MRRVPEQEFTDSLKVSEQFKRRFEWVEVTAPEQWRPGDGEELCGYFGGRTLKQGPHGQYEVILVHTPKRGPVIISGTYLISLMDAAAIPVGHPVCITYIGKVQSRSDSSRFYKKYAVAIAAGDPIPEAELPSWS